MRYLALLLLFFITPADAATDLGTVQCVDTGGFGGQCGTVNKAKEFGKREGAKILGCWPNDGRPCTAVVNNQYTLEIEFYQPETCNILHYTWTATAFSAPSNDGHMMLWTSVSLTNWVCSHQHFCSGGGNQN